MMGHGEGEPPVAFLRPDDSHRDNSAPEPAIISERDDLG